MSLGVDTTVNSLADSRSNFQYLDSLYEQEVSYTPTWTATSDPDIGDGTLQGAYWRWPFLALVKININFGSTTTYGSGAWVFGLPFAPAGGVAMLAIARMLDLTNGNAYTGVIELGTAPIFSVRGPNTDTWDNNTPITAASGDRFTATLWYPVKE